MSSTLRRPFRTLTLVASRGRVRFTPYRFASTTTAAASSVTTSVKNGVLVISLDVASEKVRPGGS